MMRDQSRGLMECEYHGQTAPGVVEANRSMRATGDPALELQVLHCISQNGLHLSTASLGSHCKRSSKGVLL